MNTSVVADCGAGDAVETNLDFSGAPLEPMDPLRGKEQRS